MATVFLGRDHELRREVAVKVLFPHLCKRSEVVSRFHREARAAAALDHPHILRVLDVGGGAREEREEEEIDPPFIVLELVRGMSLQDFIAEHEAPISEVVASVGAALADALGEAHRAGVVHRDVKPANVMIADGGRLVLADFGVARVSDEDSVVTRTGALLGTPSFMAPEQASGGAVDRRSDLYSLGASLYQLATGSLPFSGSTARVVSSIAAGEFVAPQRRNPKIGPDLARVIERLMALDPEDRYQDAEAAGAALREAAREGGVEDPEALLERYFADPEGQERRLAEEVTEATLVRAKEAASSRSVVRALALADRVLALDADNREALALVERLSTGRRRRAVALAAGGLAACGAALAWMFLGGGEKELAAHRADAGAPEVAMAPAEGQGEEKGRSDASPSPLRRQDASPSPLRGGGSSREEDPPRRLRGRGRDSDPVNRKSVSVSVSVPDAGSDSRGASGTGTGSEPAPEPEPEPDATLTVVMDSWCNLSIDGVARGRVFPKKTLRLRPGRHEIVCSKGALGTWKDVIELAPGERRSLEGTLLTRVRVKVALEKADAVRIGRKTVADGGRITITQGRERVVFLRGGKQVGAVHHVNFPRVSSCTLRDRPEVDCYR